MAVSISPIYNDSQFFNNDGTPMSGGLIFSYQAGSDSSEQTTYSDSAGTIANPNPIQLDSSGRPDVTIWLIDGDSYNLVLTLPDGTTVIDHHDNIVGVVGATNSNGIATAIWNPAAAPTYVNSNTFLIPDNVVNQFAVGNRIRVGYDGSDAFTYGTVTAVTFNDPNTQVTIQGDTLDSSMNAIYWSALIASGITVDASAVSFTSGLPNNDPTTVAGQLTATSSSLTNTQTILANELIVNATTNTGNVYALSPSSGSVSYVLNQEWKVLWNATSTGPVTLNISALGALNVFQYDSTGAKVTAIIIANMISDVMYDGTDLILLDQLPQTLPIRTHYSLSSGNNGATARTVFLAAGTWQLTLTTTGSDEDGGTANINVTQVGSIDTVGTVTTSFRLFRSGGAGFGRLVYGTNTAVANYSVSAGTYNMSMLAEVVTGTSLSQYVPQGAILTLEML